MTKNILNGIDLFMRPIRFAATATNKMNWFFGFRVLLGKFTNVSVVALSDVFDGAN